MLSTASVNLESIMTITAITTSASGKSGTAIASCKITPMGRYTTIIL